MAENSNRDSASMPTAEEVAKLMAESRQLDANGYRSLILRSLRDDTPEQRVEAAAAMGNMHRMAFKVKTQSDYTAAMSK